MKQIKMLLSTFAIAAVLVMNACADGESEDQTTMLLAVAAAAAGAGTAPGVPDSGTADLPQPTLDTARLVLGGDTLILTNKSSCQTGGTGIGFAMVDADNLPTLFIHNIDFALNTGVSVGTGGSVLDIDVSGGVYSPSANCTATVMENSASVYDLQVLDCPLSGAGVNPATNTVSFRVRCGK